MASGTAQSRFGANGRGGSGSDGANENPPVGGNDGADGTPLSSEASDRLERFRRAALPGLRELIAPQRVLALTDAGLGTTGNGNGDGGPGLSLVIVAEAFAGVDWLERRVRVARECDVGPGVRLLCLTPEEFRRRLELPGVVRQAGVAGLDVLGGEANGHQ